MRTLTQVWFVHTSISLVLLLICFQLFGRIGILFGLGVVLILLYAALRKTLQFVWLPLQSHKLCGNDPTGFSQLIQEKQYEFGFKSIEIYLTQSPTPPLVWKNNEESGRIILNENLLPQLNFEETKLLAQFLLAHLQCRSFVLPQFLSSIRVSFFVLNVLSALTSFSLNQIAQKHREVLNADLKFLSTAQTNPFEAGYFLNKLHQFSFHHPPRFNHFCFFSTLSFNKILSNEEFGLPYLHVRLHKIMGFTL